MILRILIPGILACAPLAAVELVAEGVLGNSGGQGATLVRAGVEPARGLGPAVDRWGCLWDRAGKGVPRAALRSAHDPNQLGGGGGGEQSGCLGAARLGEDQVGDDAGVGDEAHA